MVFYVAFFYYMNYLSFNITILVLKVNSEPIFGFSLIQFHFLKAENESRFTQRTDIIHNEFEKLKQGFQYESKYTIKILNIIILSIYQEKYVSFILFI